MPYKLYQGIVLLLLWFTGLYLRLPVLITAPLGPKIAADFNLGQSALGALTTAPVLLLGIGSLLSAPVISRFGARNTVVFALGFTAIFSGLRGLAPHNESLLALTLLMGLAIAALQTALPALVPRWCPRFIALGSAVYLNGMMVGEFTGAGLTLPLVYPLAGYEWRNTLLLWSIPILIIAPSLFFPKVRGPAPVRRRFKDALPRINDRTMWLFGLMVGTTAGTFFAVNAYMDSILQEKGMGEWLNSALLIFNVSQMLSSILMIVAARRVLALPRLLFITASLIVLGLAGFLLFTHTWSMAFAVILGFASAWQLIVLVALPPLMHTAEDAARLAAGMFTIGYCIAFILPVAAGFMADLTGSTQGALWVIVFFNLICVPPCWYIKTR